MSAKWTFLKELGLSETNSGVFAEDWIVKPSGGEVVSLDPTSGQPIATVLQAGPADYEQVVAAAQSSFERFRILPAPKRGEIVRQIGDALRAKKDPLGKLVTLEMGKIHTEGQGEVQEMIDMADLAVGLSRQLYGSTMQSERPFHRMYEQWHPLGPVGVITAFNFPVAVWAWNALVAMACGDSVIWKPSPMTPLCAVAVQNIIAPILRAHGFAGLSTLAVGDVAIGQRLAADPRVPLISATGSCGMGRAVGKVVADRFGRSLLELGGNNAIIVMDDADLNLALRGVLFGAAGTAGQRCTSTRRVFLHRAIAEDFTQRLVKAYRGIPVGDPLDAATLVGPLVNQAAVDNMMRALEEIRREGGEILIGGHRVDRPGYFVEPTIVKATSTMQIVREETFAPILYLFTIDSLDEAIALQNSVEQGLSSAIFTRNMQHAEVFLSARGSDCGIANVNIGTSGAEIGGAFGGEKSTGGGREAGSDAWKAYMRRQTCTINYSNDLPLAQGLTFGI